MELSALKEKTWLEATSMLKDMKSIPTLKKRAVADVLSVTSETILLKVKKRDEPLDSKEKHFNTAIDQIHIQGRVRQKFIDSNRARYILSIMSMLPYFEVEVIHDGKKKTPTLVFKK